MVAWFFRALVILYLMLAINIIWKEIINVSDKVSTFSHEMNYVLHIPRNQNIIFVIHLVSWLHQRIWDLYFCRHVDVY